MASERGLMAFDGSAISLESQNKAYTAAAHADDYVFAEFFKLLPYNGSAVAKAILPYAVVGTNADIVKPGVAATPLIVMPFRAAVGSRIAANGAPAAPPPSDQGDPVITTAAEQNYRDIRSAVFAAQAAGALGYPIPASAFASGGTGGSGPRWDLVYATIYVDQPSAQTTTLVKPATAGTVAPRSTPPSLLTSMGSPPQATTGPTPAISVVMGTPTSSSSPLVPSAPADAPGIYNIPIAAVYIPVGYVSGTGTFPTTSICPVATIATVSPSLGAVRSGPASESTGKSIAEKPEIFTGSSWATSGLRPSEALSATMTGGEERWILLDALIANASGVFSSGDDADKTADWRNRYIEFAAYTSGSSPKFASDPTATGGTYCPNAAASCVAGSSTLRGCGQSFRDDSVSAIGGSSIGAGFVCILNHTLMTSIASGSNAVGLYVDLATGKLKYYLLGAPNVRLIIKVSASGAFNNP